MIVEKDDFWEEEQIATKARRKRNQEEQLQAALPKRAKYVCLVPECKQQPLMLDSQEGHYVCTNCGLVSSSAVFDTEVAQLHNKNEATFLAANHEHMETDKPYQSDRHTSVPRHLFPQQNKADREYADPVNIRAKQIERAVQSIASNLSPMSDTIKSRATELIQTYIRTHYNNLIEQDKEWKLEYEMELEEFQSTQAQLDKLCIVCKQHLQCSHTKDGTACLACRKRQKGCCGARYCWDCETEAKHECRPSAPRPKTTDKVRMIRAYESLASACVKYAAAENNITYRNKDFEPFGSAQVLIRWSRKLHRLLRLPVLDVLDSVSGWIQRFHLKYQREVTRRAWEEESKDMDVMSQYFLSQPREKKSKYAGGPTVEQVDTMLGDLLMNVKYELVKLETKQKPELHGHQPRILAAVIVYLRIRLRKYGARPTITELCKTVDLETRTFWSCKNDLIKLLE